MSDVVLDNVAAGRGLRRYLTGVDLRLAPGVTAVIGANGAGKSTLLRVLATADRPKSGSVQLLGHDVDHPDGRRRARRLIGWSPQEPQLSDRLTVGGALAYVATARRVADVGAAVGSVVDRFALGAVVGRRIGLLAGGVRRRVEVAQALLVEPRLLVLDEPTSGLDVEARSLFRDVLDGRPLGTWTVVATHRLASLGPVEAVVEVADGSARLVGRPGVVA